MPGVALNRGYVAAVGLAQPVLPGVGAEQVALPLDVVLDQRQRDRAQAGGALVAEQLGSLKGAAETLGQPGITVDEPAPVTVHNENGLSPFLIVADHAGNSIPRALGRLGVSEIECERHIAWDIGIGAVCRLSAQTSRETAVRAVGEANASWLLDAILNRAAETLGAPGAG